MSHAREPGGPDPHEPGGGHDPARLAAAQRELEALAKQRRALVVELEPGRWRLERKPGLFRVGLDYWEATLQPDGGLSVSERQWRPQPKYE